MVAQLVMGKDGVYEYQEVDTRPKNVVSSTQEFEAYEGAKEKQALVSAPDIAAQTEKVIRETPGLNRTEFDESTGQFVTTSNVEGKELNYIPGATTPESTEPTALQKVMKMTEGRTVAEPDYKKIISDAAKASRPTWKDQAISSAFNVGGKVLTNYITKKMTGSAGDLAVNYMTQNVLGKTLSGRLASGMSGSMMSNPYVAAGTMLLGSGAGEQIAKGVGDVAGGVIETVSNVASSAWEAVTGGSVICTELNRQGFISNEDYKTHWNYTLDKWTKDELKGYWIWAMPTAKKMKDKFTLRGYIYNLLVEQISLLISKLIKKKKIKEVLA